MPVEFQCLKCKTALITNWGHKGAIRCSRCGDASPIPDLEDAQKAIEKRFRLGHFSGTVVGAESDVIPIVSGSGSITTAYRPLAHRFGYADTSGRVEIGTTVSERCRLWVRETSGQERIIESDRRLLPVRVGQSVSVIFVEDAHSRQREFVALANHTSQQSAWIQEPAGVLKRAGINLAWSVSDPRPRPERPTPTPADIITQEGTRLLLSVATGTLGLVMVVAGFSAGIVLVAVPGIILFVGGIGLLWHLIDDCIRARATLPSAEPVVRCFVSDESNDLVRTYFSRHFRAFPPLPVHPRAD